jgi:hypothetical protein
MLKQMPELTTVFWAEHAPSHQNILPSKSATYELSLEN